MAEDGARVTILDVLDAQGKALSAELTGRGHKVAYQHVDVTDEAAMKSAIDRTARDLDGLQVMVNNAGISGSPKSTDHVTEAEWDRVQAVNVKGVFFGTKHAIPHMRAAGKGSIINLSSIAGLIGIGGIAPYHASKGAVRLMSRNDAMTYAPE
jgi:NAD(P)-dependent dehydrogenase (short-subunit alcohol dehydrogenase family)